MPHPFFGSKDVFYIEKKVAKKKAFLGQASLYQVTPQYFVYPFFWREGLLQREGEQQLLTIRRAWPEADLMSNRQFSASAELWCRHGVRRYQQSDTVVFLAGFAHCAAVLTGGIRACTGLLRCSILRQAAAWHMSRSDGPSAWGICLLTWCRYFASADSHRIFGLNRRCLVPARLQYVLAKKGPLGKIWLAAHMEKKVPKLQIMSTNIPVSVESIENPTVPLALRVSGHLLLGVVRIFSRKVNYLLTDCSEAVVKIKDAFRGPGAVDMPGATTRSYADITNTEQYDEMDLTAALPSQAMAFTIADDELLAGINTIYQDLDDITMVEDGGLLQQNGIGLIQGRCEGAGEAPEEHEGFGQNENFEVFFEAQDAPLLLGYGPEEKRRESNSLFEDLPERERMRLGSKAVMRGGDPLALALDLPAADEPFPIVTEASFEEHHELPLPEEAFADPSGFDAVITADTTGPSSAARLSNARHQGSAKRPNTRKAKRQMKLDEELQMSTELMKSQLADTSKIVFSHPFGESRSIGFATFLAPPSLPFIAVELVRTLNPRTISPLLPMLVLACLPSRAHPLLTSLQTYFLSLLSLDLPLVVD